ncbi:putative disease resistance protein [Dorcoceras hygrometricum]|uniref:Putative disease resistance protein n=1 Tax=Dorcoceras hygrometricum TaxID=472368 RepID=A0A2Z7CUX8_9LAMI|nr:putative disease resistance protein [Dorcoceras hygrometricum]
MVKLLKDREVAGQQPLEAGIQVSTMKSKSGTSSDEDSCALARLKKRADQANKEGAPPNIDNEAETQPGPIHTILAGGDRASTAGGPEANTETTPAMETRYVASLDITPFLTWEEFKVQLAQLTNSTSDEQLDRGTWHQALERTTDKKHIEEVDRTIENVETLEEEEAEKEHPDPEKQMLGSMDGQKTLEQPAPEEEGQPQRSSTHSDSSYGSSWRISVHNEDSVDSFGPYSDLSLSLSPSFNVGPSSSNLQMVAYTANREVNNHPANEDREVSSQTGPQPINLQNPQIIEATTKKVTSLEGNVSSLGLKVEHIRDDVDFTRCSTVQLRQQLKNVLDGMEIKIDVLESTLVRKFADNQQNLSALETGLVRHFADSQQHLVDEVTMLKSQVAEIVECLKELRDSKNGE